MTSLWDQILHWELTRLSGNNLGPSNLLLNAVIRPLFNRHNHDHYKICVNEERNNYKDFSLPDCHVRFSTIKDLRDTSKKIWNSWGLKFWNSDHREPRSHDILMFVCLQKDAEQCCGATTPESIHTKDESKRGIAFAFIFGVNWPVQWVQPVNRPNHIW